MDDRNVSLDGAARKRERARMFFEWFDEIAGDHELPPAALKVAVILKRYLDKGENLVAFPSRKTLATAAGLSVRTVSTVIDLLSAHGHLHIEPGHGPGRSNTYRPVLNKVQPVAPIDGAKGAASCTISKPDKVQFGADNRCRKLPPTSLKEESTEKVRLPPTPADAGSGCVSDPWRC